jgi:hypothetical protein
MFYFGWALIFGAIICTGLVMYLILTGTSHPTIIVRGFFIIPFVLWMGIRTVNREIQKERQKRIDAIVRKVQEIYDSLPEPGQENTGEEPDTEKKA